MISRRFSCSCCVNYITKSKTLEGAEPIGRNYSRRILSFSKRFLRAEFKFSGGSVTQCILFHDNVIGLEMFLMTLPRMTPKAKSLASHICSNGSFQSGAFQDWLPPIAIIPSLECAWCIERPIGNAVGRQRIKIAGLGRGDEGALFRMSFKKDVSFSGSLLASSIPELIQVGIIVNYHKIGWKVEGSNLYIHILLAMPVGVGLIVGLIRSTPSFGQSWTIKLFKTESGIRLMLCTEIARPRFIQSGKITHLSIVVQKLSENGAKLGHVHDKLAFINMDYRRWTRFFRYYVRKHRSCPLSTRFQLPPPKVEFEPIPHGFGFVPTILIVGLVVVFAMDGKTGGSDLVRHRWRRPDKLRFECGYQRIGNTTLDQPAFTGGELELVLEMSACREVEL
ncbi:hypothetical protein Tco_0255935 [Tanacetum coccineum]